MLSGLENILNVHLKEEPNMKTRMAVSALIIVMSLCSLAFASDGRRGRGSADRVSQDELLAQLPAEKETLYHQTMREVRKQGFEMRAQVKQLREEIKNIVAADQFDEELFRAKTKSLEELQMKRRASMDEAIATLARQFTADERQILVQLLPGKSGHGRRLPERGVR